MATEVRGSSWVNKAKPRDDGGGAKGKGLISSPQLVKRKVEASSGGKFQVSDSKQKSAVSVSKSVEVRGKTTVSSPTKMITKTKTVRAKIQKKVYSLPGQKYDPPEEREPLRIFYESLSKQIPSSEMAEFWMMEHGMLSPERAKRACERKQRRQQQLRMGTPIKSLKLERTESSKKPLPLKNGEIQAKKRVNYSDDDNDFIVKYKKPKG